MLTARGVPSTLTRVPEPVGAAQQSRIARTANDSHDCVAWDSPTPYPKFNEHFAMGE